MLEVLLCYALIAVQVKGPPFKLTFDSKWQMDDPIACIMSTAELTAFLTVSTSACKRS